MKHGRTEMPFGKYKGIRIRLLPDSYLSWLTTILCADKHKNKWRWLRDSLLAELRFRGLRYDLADTIDDLVKSPELQQITAKPKRCIRLEDR